MLIFLEYKKTLYNLAYVEFIEMKRTGDKIITKVSFANGSSLLFDIHTRDFIYDLSQVIAGTENKRFAIYQITRDRGIQEITPTPRGS